MIRQSFIILDRVGARKERTIWDKGVKDWDDFLETEKIYGIAKHKKQYFDRMIEKARNRLYSFDSGYFCRTLPSSEHWRLYDFFREDCCYLDIEASSVADGYVTVVGLFDGIDTKIMINGVNLDYSALKTELRKYKMIVSFNGLTFDKPFLEKHFPELLPNIPHFDLRHACQKVGLRGGLKQVEQQLGILRKNQIVDRMYGGDPIKLWRMYRATGDDYYLKLLVEYNEEDIVNLKPIAEFVYQLLAEKLNSLESNTPCC
jgi:uncharacterized protein YprB with RNaseH-like and TPR domain